MPRTSGFWPAGTLSPCDSVSPCRHEFVCMVSNGDQSLCQPCQGEEEEEELVNMKDALFDDPIVGHEQVLLDEQGPGALDPVPLTSPPSMTPAQWAKHVLTHLPYHPGCPVCAATRRPNDQHRISHDDERTIPLLVADYCFVKSSADKVLQALRVMILYPYTLYVACAVPNKRGEHARD